MYVTDKSKKLLIESRMCIKAFKNQAYTYANNMEMSTYHTLYANWIRWEMIDYISVQV